MSKAKQLVKRFIYKGIDYAANTHDFRNNILEIVQQPKLPILSSIKNRPRPGEESVVTNDTTIRSDIVFITSRFRSGSTVVWNAFRQLQYLTTYYEPFNERRFFDSDNRGDSVDSTHRGVANYWEEYKDLEKLNDLYKEEWTRKDLLMDESSWNPEMLKFIETLIESANGRPIMQFNRIDFRLPWINRHFPNASVIHLWRNPREQWCSTLLDIRKFPYDSDRRNFIDHFYLIQWVEDLKGAFPFFRNSENLHPYQLFYLVWKLSWLFGQKYASLSISYDSIVSDTQAAMSELALELGLDNESASKMVTVFEQPKDYRWATYAPVEWFEKQEKECESILDQYLN